MFWQQFKEVLRIKLLFWKESFAMLITFFFIPTMFMVTARYLNDTMTDADHRIIMDYKEEIKKEDLIWANATPIIWLFALFIAGAMEGFEWWMMVPMGLILLAAGLDICLQAIASGDLPKLRN